MKKIIGSLFLLLLASAAAFSADAVPAMSKTLTNARYVYVTSYDGGQFNLNIFPADRAAISAVQDAIHEWGKLVVVNRAQDADIVLMVQSRPSEDLLAVYDGRGWPRNTYLWRVMGRNGLDEKETPLMRQFETAFEQAAR